MKAYITYGGYIFSAFLRGYYHFPDVDLEYTLMGMVGFVELTAWKTMEDLDAAELEKRFGVARKNKILQVED